MAAVLSEKHQREMTDAVRRHADAMQACEEDRARLRLVAVIFLVECLGRSCCNVGSRTGARGGGGWMTFQILMSVSGSLILFLNVGSQRGGRREEEGLAGCGREGG